MDDFRLNCKCGESVIKSRPDGTVIRCKVLIVKGKDVFAVCKGCSTEVSIPLIPVDSGPDLYLFK